MCRLKEQLREEEANFQRILMFLVDWWELINLGMYVDTSINAATKKKERMLI